MKVSEADTRKKIQLLTLEPQSCSHETIADFFGISDYIVRESRELYRKSGIPGDVESKKGRLVEIIPKYSSFRRKYIDILSK